MAGKRCNVSAREGMGSRGSEAWPSYVRALGVVIVGLVPEIGLML